MVIIYKFQLYGEILHLINNLLSILLIKLIIHESESYSDSPLDLLILFIFLVPVLILFPGMPNKFDQVLVIACEKL